MGNKKILYINPFKDVFLNCKKILGYKEGEAVAFTEFNKKDIYDGKLYMVKDFPEKGKDKRKLKKLNKKFNFLWTLYEDPSYYLYRKHYVNKLEMCNHIFFWVVLAIFLALTVFVYCTSPSDGDMFQTFFMGGAFAFILLYYGICVLINIRKNQVMKHNLKKAKKEKDRIVKKIKKILMKSPLYDENTSLDFLDAHINTMYENELLKAKANEEKTEVIEVEKDEMQVEADSNREVKSTTEEINEEKLLEGVVAAEIVEETEKEMTLESDSNKEVISTTEFDESIITPEENASLFNEVSETPATEEVVEETSEEVVEETTEEVEELVEEIPSEETVEVQEVTEETPVEEVVEETEEVVSEETPVEEETVITEEVELVGETLVEENFVEAPIEEITLSESETPSEVEEEIITAEEEPVEEDVTSTNEEEPVFEESIQVENNEVEDTFVEEVEETNTPEEVPYNEEQTEEVVAEEETSEEMVTEVEEHTLEERNEE